jgi:hypothetical protein
MIESRQTVIYRLNMAHDPAWQFHSMPESIVGGGNTLDTARSEYREALKFSVETEVLPTVHEYVEREIGNLGIWLRLPIDHPDFDGVLGQVGRQIAGYPDDHGWFFANRTAGGDPVIVTAPSDAPLRSILVQMSIHDSLILAMLRHTPDKVQNVWLALTGAETASGTGEPTTSLASMGLTPDSPLRELLEAAVKRQLTTVSAPALC